MSSRPVSRHLLYVRDVIVQSLRTGDSTRFFWGFSYTFSISQGASIPHHITAPITSLSPRSKPPSMRASSHWSSEPACGRFSGNTLDILPRAPRRSKRRHTNDDGMEFLGNSFGNGPRRARVGINANERGTMTWPVPSSDLLKCVHHSASQYYATRGLLSRAYRHGRAKLAQAADSIADADDPLAEGVRQGGNKLWNAEGVTKDKEFSSGKRQTSPESVLDMYKAFDGSALIAIGMLLQEHVSTLLNPHIPLGWEVEMEAAGLLSEDESAVLESRNSENAEIDKSDDEEIEIVSSDED
ncbi:hypothetical protein F5148DRAFT_66457 [Russula earlei]|uniref:Uncharacterized protein n=1 Tax=Russula earlei TaxID=71964 RepID=A0ACC0U8M5_9AGAM|nr:hypothetical protein F5148DRAFT_66457 [Russula earlei]